MIRIRFLAVAMALVLQTFAVRAQFLPGVSSDTDSVRLPKWEPHLSVTTGFMGSSFGDNRLFTSVAPSIVYRPSDRWTLSAGFRITSDMGLNPNYSLSAPAKDLAPYKRNGGTGLASAYAAGSYRVSENFWLAAAVHHIGGTYAPLYGFANGEVLDVSATAISAAAAFRFNNDSFLQLSFTVMRDHYGTMPFLYHDMWMHCGGGAWGLYASPSDYYRMASPFSPYYYGGLY